jgi:hypothetical protein
LARGAARFGTVDCPSSDDAEKRCEGAPLLRETIALDREFESGVIGGGGVGARWCRLLQMT